MYKILIADDEQLERSAIRAILNKGIDTVIEMMDAVNGRESIVKAKSFAPDIIFLDIKMPGIDGIEAARAIRKFSNDVSIVFLTAFNQFEYAQEAIQIGVEDFIIKPAPESRVLEVVTKLISKIEKRKNQQYTGENNELKLGRVKSYLETETVYNLAVRGMDRDKFNNYLTILDLQFESGVAGIASLQFDTYPIDVGSEYHKHVLKKRTAYILKSAITQLGFSVLVNLELANIYFVVIRSPDGNNNFEDEDWSELSMKILGDIKKALSVEALIGFGEVFRDPEGSIASFASAKSKLGSYFGLNGTSNDSLLHMNSNINLAIDLEELLLSGSREEILETFQKLREHLEYTGYSFSQVKQYMLELAAVIKHSASYPFPEGMEGADLSILNKAENINILMDEFLVFLNAFLHAKSNASNMHNNPAIDAACRFISDNFAKDISLEDAAEKANLSSFYFSKVFKKIKGITFIEYITNCRLKEAKRLLRTTNLTIREISEAVGYGDQNYFTRVFKRIESISPSTYRTKKS